MNAHKRNTKIFIILIPLFILIGAFIFDESIKIVESKRLEITTKSIIKNILTTNIRDYHNTVKTEYEKKKIKADRLVVDADYGSMYIYNVHTFVSFFGKIFKINEYRAEISIKGTLIDGEVEFEKVEINE